MRSVAPSDSSISATVCIVASESGTYRGTGSEISFCQYADDLSLVPAGVSRDGTPGLGCYEISALTIEDAKSELTSEIQRIAVNEAAQEIGLNEVDPIGWTANRVE